MSSRQPGQIGSQRSEKALQGSWYVLRSSLRLWQKRSQVSVTYTPLPGEEVLDMVRFVQGGRATLILGLDTLDPKEPGVYVWRGLSPLTRWTRSIWHLLAADPEAQHWAVTVFARTAFTLAGLDIYSRTPDMSSGQLVQATAAGQDTQASRFVSKLFIPGA